MTCISSRICYVIHAVECCGKRGREAQCNQKIAVEPPPMSTVTLAPGADIQAAINANPAGTVFELSSGIYRGQKFLPKSNDQFIGDPSGGTTLSGALVLARWTASGGYWKTGGLPKPLAGHGDAGGNRLALNREDLFFDNSLYQRVGSLQEVKAGTWYFDQESHVAYIAVNPMGHTVEYSASPFLIQDDNTTGVLVKHLTIEKYATDAQSGPIQGVRDGRIVDVTSRWNHGAGITIGAGTTIQGGHYIDNGQIGILGSRANGALVQGAEIARNNYAGYSIDWEAGGMKLVLSSNVVISGNKVHDNDGMGLWSDEDDSNFTYTNNTITHNTGNGILYEISYGNSIIRDNSVSCNGRAQIFISNSEGLQIIGNSVVVGAANSGIDGGIAMLYINRGIGALGPHDTKNNSIHNNFITHLGGGENGLWIFYNEATATTWTNRWDGNTYFVTNATETHWHFGRYDYQWQRLIDVTGRESHGAMIVVPKQITDPCQGTKFGLLQGTSVDAALIFGVALLAVRDRFLSD